MTAARFHNALRILLSLDGYDLINAGVADQNWGTAEASERDQMGAFLEDPAREALRMPDANFDRLMELVESRQPPAPVATNRPGDQASVYAEETGIDYATALVHCNMD
ncbi:hypothetical protein [Mesorhizobium sp. M7A.F.Ca.MR.245.00.0.0]|uniref:hypothetical protein n=1 Tax=Mesorhizobium sp. M7A.F.Ca.MR.245.00.0.0 TaxID=2496778 RepID=UPI000FC9B56F|nr:hypothetical protein [Mesorhizobium sp. M7A.F.Ca.MR.245.00.0.0]RUV19925.1 hypothetical protein EOB80_17040 [Mesorhizobium sp. M7A.F.Ca.MR.245.00.0.0]RUV51480.1 hypothetical protein EOB77_10630 [Mesorhizobium sp. M7A.F.Ca.MR.228.00.0.0]